MDGRGPLPHRRAIWRNARLPDHCARVVLWRRCVELVSAPGLRKYAALQCRRVAAERDEDCTFRESGGSVLAAADLRSVRASGLAPYVNQPSSFLSGSRPGKWTSARNHTARRLD